MKAHSIRPWATAFLVAPLLLAGTSMAADAAALAPSAPSKPLATPGDGLVTVEWVAPASSGSSPITDYVVQVSVNGTPFVTTNDGVSARTTATVGRVSATSVVRVRVAAKSAAGTGPWSPASDGAHPITVPDAPRYPTLSAFDSGVSVSWTPPAFDGGSPVRAYRVHYRPTPPAMKSTTPGTGTTVSPRVVGGTGTSITDIPWQVEVEIGGTDLCGGTLVDPQWVVTAAHCVSGAAASQVIVHSGITRLTDMSGANAIHVVQVLAHPSWDPNSNENDIALLRLAAPAPGGVPVPLWTDPNGPAAGTLALVSGWGTQHFLDQIPSNQLRRATVRVLGGPTSGCGAYATGVDFHPEVMLCAGSLNGGVDTCNGDSGGPLVIKVGTTWKLAGITSFGEQCALAAFPGVYTRVSSFATWIQAEVANTWPMVTVTCSGGMCTHVDVPGLTNGDIVEAMITAVNAKGESLPSPVSRQVIVAPQTITAPGAPAGVLVQAHDHRVHLTWSAPTSNGGSPLIDYIVSDGATTRHVGSNTQSYDFTGLTNGVPVAFTVAAVNRVATGPASGPSPFVAPGLASYVPLSGVRVMDTRATGTTADGVGQRTGAVQTAAARTVRIGGRVSIPTDARAVAINVLVPAQPSKGALTLYACGAAKPALPNVHFAAGIDTTLLVVTALSAGGSLCMATTAPVHVVLDAQGYFPAAAHYTVVPTTRLVTGTRQAGSTATFVVTGKAGVPAKAKAVVVKVTATSSAPGTAVVYACTATRTSSTSVTTGGSRPMSNLMVLTPSATGRLCLYTSAAASASVDVVGYLPADGQITVSGPRRLVDSRPTGATVDGLYARIGTRAARAGLGVKVAGRAGIAADAAAANLTVTVVAPTAAGTLRVTACGASTTGISIAFASGQTVTNTVLARIGVAGKVCVSSSVPVDVVVDAAGWLPRV